jgi:demethylmenaquinone methyltransferase/2-methoxy-6-polyprenyl-1,4-benzoquinol methylase
VPAEAASARTRHARELFAPLAPTYDRYARLLSLAQDPQWRRFLVSRVDATPGSRVLDVATGTGAVARELIRQKACVVVGVDQSAEMLAVARAQLPTEVELVEANAERLPFGDASFDGLTFTYLLRYVDEPGETLRELARVVRPGGTIASLEFAVPAGPWRALWRIYVDAVLPTLGRLLGHGWDEVGRFLGSSIGRFWREYPLDRQLDLWRDAGIGDLRHRRLSLGGGIVIWGKRR